MKSLLATGDRVELDKDVAFAVGVNSNVDDFAILLVTFGLDFDLKVFDPAVAIVALLPIALLVTLAKRMRETYSSGSKAFSILMHLDGIGSSTTGARGLAATGWAP